MSATNRSNVRVASDFYATPAWCTRAILPHLPVTSVLDPCAGDGAICCNTQPLQAASPVKPDFFVPPARRARLLKSR